MRKITILMLVMLLVLLMPASTMAQAPQPGEEGIGDPFFPQLGNGGYDALHYTLDLSVDVASNTIIGTTTMEAQATEALSAFNLDFVGLTVDEIQVDDVPADYSRHERELTIIPSQPLLNGEIFTVIVSYSGVPGEGVPGEFPTEDIGWINYEDGVVVISEPTGAAAWYPVNDHPLDKATYTLRIAVPDPYMAVANGLWQETVETDGATTYVWESSYPMASYLVTVNVAELVTQTEEGPEGLPIRNFFPPHLAEEAAEVFGRQAEMIEFFSEIFGPYPFEAYGVVLTDVDWGGALETQTLSVFDRGILDEDDAEELESPMGLLTEATSEEIVAHELAHQWFGDSVSLETWQDIWLKEGSATYASWLWFEHSAGPEVLDEIVREIYAAISELINGSIFPFGSEPTPFDDLSGQEALAQLRELGPDVLADMEKLGEALDELTVDEASAEDRTNLSDELILKIIDVLPEGELSGQEMLEILSALPVAEMSGREVYQALIVLNVYNLGGMEIFQGTLIAAPGNPPADNLYNVSVYERGALTLHALRLEVGDETFFDIMRTYHDRYRYGNASTADFMAVAEEISGQELGQFFDAWLYEEAMPDIPEMGLSADSVQ